MNWGELSRLDVDLAALAAVEAALRLRLGQALEVLGRGGHHELGFSSLAAYALERCERSVRWVEGARSLARRLEALPGLRRAVASGVISWSMGEVLGRVAQPESEAAWLEAAQGCTVREMRMRVSAALDGTARPHADCVSDGTASDGSVAEADADDDDDEKCTLTVTVDREDAWLFEATRALLGQLGMHGQDEQLEALLAEGQDTLLGALPRGSIDAEALPERDMAQQRRSTELARLRAEAEALCEECIRQKRAPHREGQPGHGANLELAVVAAAARGCESLALLSSREVDAVVRELSSRLARQELELAQRILQLHRADGWRRLGYATEAQYARERLGMSRSSFAARRALAQRLEKLPLLTSALGASIGVEAALQIARIATPRTEQAWVARALQRTVKHLREEVAAALVAVRLSGERDCLPPVNEELTAFQDLERAVVSGEVLSQTSPAVDGNAAANANDAANANAAATSGDAETTTSRESTLTGAGAGSPAAANAFAGEGQERRAWHAMLGSLGSWLSAACRMSAGDPSPCRREIASAGRVTLRLLVSRGTFVWWRGLEAQARRWLPRGLGWLKFLCLSLWRAWRHVLGTEVAYGHIYTRDRFRCTSPVCNRRDVTPHHLVFRSAGGSDADENVSAICVWCHLEGVHGGHIRATGTAGHIHWELGPSGQPCVVVHGRDRVAA